MRPPFPILPDLLGGLFLIILGSGLFTRSLESTVDRFFDNRNLGLRILGNISLSLPELVLPMFAFLGPGMKKTAVDAGTGALFGSPLFLFLFLVPLLLLSRHPFDRSMVRESPVLFVGLLGALFLLGKSFLPRLLLGLFLAGFYFLSLLLIPSEPPGDHGEEKRDRPITGSYRAIDGLLVVGGALLMTLGSHLFLSGIDLMSHHQGQRAFWIALILAPLATEAPELLTITHFLRKKDAGQSFHILWGSIHFQMTLSIAAGLVASPWAWSLPTLQAGGVLLAILAVGFLLSLFRRSSRKESPS